MKKSTLILLILLTLIATALWFLGSWWYYAKVKCACNDATTKTNIVDTSLTGNKKSATLTDNIIADPQLKPNASAVTPAPKNDEVDTDGDGLSDKIEKQIGTNPEKADSDGDGIADNEELGAEVSSPIDTDKDGIIDALDDDDDNDTLSTHLENIIGTSALLKDTDGDGLSDAEEAGDKINDAENPVALDTDNDGTINALDIDDDDDGLNTATEILLGTNSLLVDTDLDGISDDKEVGDQITQPKDSDSDGTIDALDTVDNTDTDNDGIPDQQERIIGTNIEKADSDNDGIDDIEEIGSNIKQPLDTDNDGTINALDTDDDDDGLDTRLESKLGTNPLKSDSDNDGINDLKEVGSDVKSPLDSDADGIIDALDTDAVDVAKTDDTPATPTAAPAATTDVDVKKAPETSANTEMTAEVITPAKDGFPAAMRLYFPFNSKKPVVSGEISSYFTALADWMKKDSKNSIQLTGHTDTVGPASANLALGLRRVMVIRELLIDAGVPFQQIDVISRGETQPLVEGNTQSAHLKNRRVEIIPLTVKNAE